MYVNFIEVQGPFTIHLQGAPGFEPTTLGDDTHQGMQIEPPQCWVAVQSPIGILQGS